MSFFQLFYYCLGSGLDTIVDLSSEQLLHDKRPSSFVFPCNRLLKLILVSDQPKLRPLFGVGRLRELELYFPLLSWQYNNGHANLLRTLGCSSGFESEWSECPLRLTFPLFIARYSLIAHSRVLSHFLVSLPIQKMLLLYQISPGSTVDNTFLLSELFQVLIVLHSFIP